MKKLLLSLAALFVMLPACTKSDAGGSKEDYMRLTWWGNTVRDERTLKTVQLYQSANPGVTIETETTGWAGYWDKLNTQASAGNLPDLIQHDYAYIMQWANRNQLLDLTPYTQNGVLDVSQIPDESLSAGQLNGKLYGISMGTNAMGMAYDPAVLEKAGIGIPDSAAWTLKDFENIALTVYRNTGVKTLPLGTTDVKVVFEMFLRQSGASFYAPDGKKLGFSDPELLKEYWDLQLRLLDAGALIPADEAFITVSIEEDSFSKGQSWVQYIWSNQIAATANGAKRPIGMLLFPSIDNAKREGTYLKPSMFFSIAAKAENPDLAAKVFNFFLNDFGANDILLAERGVPAPENVRSYLFPKMDANMKLSFDFVSLAAANSSNIDAPDPAANGEILALLRDTAQQVLNKSVSSSEGAVRFITRANQILGLSNTKNAGR
ncbi:MAG: extracellular solute-binding protein [Spirochaetaceae bacterium]|jgi:multiple sugar transport system substrate-binding protein|nr:extracellular solute-binding protein [Spirochaetaceae bacterium]